MLISIRLAASTSRRPCILLPPPPDLYRRTERQLYSSSARYKFPYNHARSVCVHLYGVGTAGDSSRRGFSTSAPRWQGDGRREGVEEEEDGAEKTPTPYYYSRPDLDPRPEPDECILRNGLVTGEEALDRLLAVPIPPGYRRAVWRIYPAYGNRGLRGAIRRRWARLIAFFWPGWVSREAIIASTLIQYDLTIVPAPWVAQGDKTIYAPYSMCKQRDKELEETMERWRAKNEAREKATAVRAAERAIKEMAEHEARVAPTASAMGESGTPLHAGDGEKAYQVEESKSVASGYGRRKAVRVSIPSPRPAAVPFENPYAAYTSRRAMPVIDTPTPSATPTSSSSSSVQREGRGTSESAAQARIQTYQIMHQDLLKRARGYDAALIPPPPTPPAPAPAIPPIAEAEKQADPSDRLNPYSRPSPRKKPPKKVDFLEPPPSQEEKMSARQLRKQAQRAAVLAAVAPRVEPVMEETGNNGGAAMEAEAVLPGEEDLMVEVVPVVESEVPDAADSGTAGREAELDDSWSEEAIERWLAEEAKKDGPLAPKQSDTAAEAETVSETDVEIYDTPIAHVSSPPPSLQSHLFRPAAQPPVRSPSQSTDGSPPLNQKLLSLQIHIDEVRDLLTLGGFDASFPRNLPQIGVKQDWDDVYATAWPFLHRIDSLANRLNTDKFAPAHVNFDHTQLPPLIPVHDAALRKRAVVTNTTWARMRQQSQAWGGDSHVDLWIWKMLEKDTVSMGHFVAVRDLLASNKTLSWLAVHYGFLDQFPAYYLAEAERPQKALATAFEAWVAAAEADHEQRGKLSDFYSWMRAVFSFKVWPDAFAELYHLQKREAPARPKGGQAFGPGDIGYGYTPTSPDDTTSLGLAPSTEDFILQGSSEARIRELEDEIDELKARMATTHYRTTIPRKSVKERYREVMMAEMRRTFLRDEAVDVDNRNASSIRGRSVDGDTTQDGQNGGSGEMTDDSLEAEIKAQAAMIAKAAEAKAAAIKAKRAEQAGKKANSKPSIKAKAKSVPGAKSTGRSKMKRLAGFKVLKRTGAPFEPVKAGKQEKA